MASAPDGLRRRGGQPVASSPAPAQSTAAKGSSPDPLDAFEVKPYLQLGDAAADPQRLALLWQAKEGQDGWAVEAAPGPGGPWTLMAPPTSWLVAVPGNPVQVHRVWAAVLAPLAPGSTFVYRILQHGAEVFQQNGARARVAPGQDQRMVVAGDLANGNGASRAITKPPRHPAVPGPGLPLRRRRPAPGRCRPG